MQEQSAKNSYVDSLFQLRRLETRAVTVGTVGIGGDNPVRVQSMTTTNTNDIVATADQSERIVKAGGEIVRYTTQGTREAANAGLIREELRKRGIDVPVVADVHFLASAALTAAPVVDAVRINPGNFLGEVKKFDEKAADMSDEEWQDKIVSHLRPLIDICKEHKTALRLGVNHGSLSDRVMAKYGDTPQGMVASAIEYLDALERLEFHDVVISIKSSNARVMVETVRRLVAAMRERNITYPLHLGVTEAGSDAEGRVKSAAGIGALLADGIGDTIRVSLTEAPEAEIPVAQMLVRHFEDKGRKKTALTPCDTAAYTPFDYTRRNSTAIHAIGGSLPPVVITRTKASKSDFYLATDGRKFQKTDDTDSADYVCIRYQDLTDERLAELRKDTRSILLLQTLTSNPTAEYRAAILKLTAAGVMSPVILHYVAHFGTLTELQVKAAADLGLLFIDGLADGVYIESDTLKDEELSDFADLLLQSTRARMTRTEFISCPGCGRTLYDIQTTVQQIKQRMGHLAGLKIGVMGCIVNGIGEMADADYGYIGAGPGRISLYRGKELVERNIPESQAIEKLEFMIRNDGRWVEVVNK